VFIPSVDGYRLERSYRGGHVAFYIGKPNDMWRMAPIHYVNIFKTKAEAEFVARGFES